MYSFSIGAVVELVKTPAYYLFFIAGDLGFESQRHLQNF